MLDSLNVIFCSHAICYGLIYQYDWILATVNIKMKENQSNTDEQRNLIREKKGLTQWFPTSIKGERSVNFLCNYARQDKLYLSWSGKRIDVMDDEVHHYLATSHICILHIFSENKESIQHLLGSHEFIFLLCLWVTQEDYF